MAYIEWTPALDIGVREIDEQHRRLVGLINSLHEAGATGGTGSAGILGELAAYAATHFALEEGYFERFGYAEAAPHKAEHAAFAARVEAFRADFVAGKTGLDAELLAYLRSWLTAHISFKDRKYKALFQANGLR